MGKKAPSPPPAPDPVATARAQAEFNVEAARTNAALNRINQNTPQGSMTYRDLGGDRWEQNVTLSPEQQRLYDLSTQAQTTYGEAANSQLNQVRDRLSSPFVFQAPVDDPGMSRDGVQEALLARINPDMERERAALESRLAAQGITMGSQAWNTGMQDWQRMANDARYGAILNAGQEQNRLATLRQQALQEQLALRAQPINEAAALLSGQQVQMPQFQAVPQVQVAAPDYQGAVGQNYAGQVSNWNSQNQRIGQQNAAYAGLLGQIGGIGAGYLGNRFGFGGR